MVWRSVRLLLLLPLLPLTKSLISHHAHLKHNLGSAEMSLCPHGFSGDPFLFTHTTHPTVVHVLRMAADSGRMSLTHPLTGINCSLTFLGGMQ